jgi:hypothetical protein
LDTNSFHREDTDISLVLTNLGEKMSDDEVDELLKAVDTSSGEINYVGMLFLRTLSPLLTCMN